MADLTGKNISDTYTRLVQVSESQLYDGAGSSLPINFDGDNVEIAGILTAQTYVVSESIVNTSSGSTIFGNSSDDTHTFTGNITASGDISASFIRGEAYVIQGKSLGNVIGGELVAFGYQNETKIQIGRFDNPTKIVGNITASSNILATGSIHTLGHITASGNISASFPDTNVDALHYPLVATGQNGTIESQNSLKVNPSTGTVTAAHIKATGNITASGNISCSGELFFDTINGGKF